MKLKNITQKIKVALVQTAADMRTRKFWLSWFGVALGSLILSAGYVLFTTPYKIVPGGVYGLGSVFHHIFPSIQTGTFGFFFDIPLLITGIIIFGGMFGAKTIFSAITIPIFMNTMTKFFGEDPTDTTNIIGQYLNLSDSVIVAAIFGGVLIGIGVGLIIKSGATSGGTDIICLILTKFAGMKFSAAILLVESTIVMTGMFILQDWLVPLYSLIAIFVCSKTIDFVIEGGTFDKLLFIITDKTEDMKEFIINGLDRSGTYIKSKGMYSDKDKDMIFLVVNKRQITAVKEKIKEVDDASFVVIVDAYETFGEGFKTFPEKGL